MRPNNAFTNKATIIKTIENKKKGIKNDSKNTTNISRSNKINVYQW